MAGVLTMLEDSVEQGAQRCHVCIHVSATQHPRTGVSAPPRVGSLMPVTGRCCVTSLTVQLAKR